MIEFTCPSCDRKLRAKDELAGRMGKCPGCGQPIRVAIDAPISPDVEDDQASQLQPPNEESLPKYDAPVRLDRECHYMICDRDGLVALWENGGGGWMLKTNVGEVPVKRNRDSIPTSGVFQLVELKFAMTSEGKRLAKIRCYELGSRWALTVLDQAEDAITEKITGDGCLNQNQKNAIRKAIAKQFMRPVWQDSKAVMDFLSNDDFRSPGAE